MALYKLILAYDGTDFSGFQRQKNTRTVQGVMEETLRQFGWQQETIQFAGRTDAGVHASGQVAAVSLDWQHSSVDLMNAMNARLPEDVSVMEASRTEAEFHPRYDASSRVYRYSLYHTPARQPLLERHAWRIWPEIQSGLLPTIAEKFVGEHDYSAFGRAMKAGGSTVREVFSSQWLKTAEGWQYEVEANAFLYHMVRRLVFVQVQFAWGKLTLAEVERALHDGSPLKPGLAPAHGLLLARVKYDGRSRTACEDEKN